MKYVAVFLLTLSIRFANSQSLNNLYLDVKMNGYIFVTPSGIFFQPAQHNSKSSFLSRIDNRSFKIFENHESVFSYVLPNIGDSLSVKLYYQDSLDRSVSKNKYIIHFFEASVEMQLNFDATTKTDTLGYAFIFKDSLYYYGNLMIDNYLKSIIPRENKYLKMLYKSYKDKGYGSPTDLDEEYKRRIIYPSSAPVSNSRYRQSAP